jgi:hypothetical protein
MRIQNDTKKIITVLPCYCIFSEVPAGVQVLKLPGIFPDKSRLLWVSTGVPKSIPFATCVTTGVPVRRH